MDPNFINSDQTQPGKSFKEKLPWFILIFSGVLLATAIIWLALGKPKEKNVEKKETPAVVLEQNEISEKPVETPIKRFVAAPFSMDIIKRKGCVADGILSGYAGNIGEMVSLIERSKCQYIHRAMETWLTPPDFDQAANVMAEFNKPGMVFGMFVAEAIDTGAKYYDVDSGEKFDFSEMCRSNTENSWGVHSCKPSFEKPEYRRYLKYITKRAMDIGIQSFLFGQIHYQNQQPLPESEMPEIIQYMRNYAKRKGIQIIIGAQTNSITDENYLKLFDYIEGGVGIDSRGNIENGPCWSRKGSCWALLWHDDFRTKAKNVILNLDWSGIQSDDMSMFARMNEATRRETLRKLYTNFTSRDIGFMMPFLAPLYRENGGCYGPKRKFYSPDNNYKCRDENAINNILSGK
jgi:hypothetical protein